MIYILTTKEAVVRAAMQGGRYHAPCSREEAESDLAERADQLDLRGWQAYFYVGNVCHRGCKGVLENNTLTVFYPPEGDKYQFECKDEKQAHAILLTETRAVYDAVVSNL